MNLKIERRSALWYLGLPVLLAALTLLKYRQQDAMTLLRSLLLLVMLAAWVLWAAALALVRWELLLRLLLPSLVGGLVLSGAALLVYLLSRKGLGGGDVKFLAAAGLYLTVGPGLTAVILGTLLSALTALVLMALRKLSVKDAIPLIPFLYVGILVVLFLP